MNEQKRVSMIMPCYNAAPYLDHMLESVYLQTYDNIELIIAYDDSNDGTLQILSNWAEKFKERGYLYLIVRNPSRAGIVNGINAALPYFTGEYLTFPDSDDYMYPEFVSTMVEALEENPEYKWARCDNYKVIGRDIAFDKSNLADFNSETEYGQEYDLGLDKRYEHLGSVMNLLLYTIPRAPWRMMCRADFLLSVLPNGIFYPHPSSHELPIALPLAAAGEFLYVPKPLYKYTIHKDGYYNSRTKNLHQMIPYLDSMEQLAEGCIRLLPVGAEEKERYHIANRLYYSSTKAYYAMIHNAYALAEIYAEWLSECLVEFTRNDKIVEGFPAMLYWKYYFKLAPKIAAGVKLDSKKENFDSGLWKKIKESNEVILYGAGNNCESVLSILQDLNIDIKEIWDANASSINEKYGYSIKNINAEIPKESAIIITILNRKVAEEVKTQLQQLGFNCVLSMDEVDKAFRFSMLDKYFSNLV